MDRIFFDSEEFSKLILQYNRIQSELEETEAELRRLKAEYEAESTIRFDKEFLQCLQMMKHIAEELELQKNKVHMLINHYREVEDKNISLVNRLPGSLIAAVRVRMIPGALLMLKGQTEVRQSNLLSSNKVKHENWLLDLVWQERGGSDSE